jgi:hypothetical protein
MIPEDNKEEEDEEDEEDEKDDDEEEEEQERGVRGVIGLGRGLLPVDLMGGEEREEDEEDEEEEGHEGGEEEDEEGHEGGEEEDEEGHKGGEEEDEKEEGRTLSLWDIPEYVELCDVCSSYQDYIPLVANEPADLEPFAQDRDTLVIVDGETCVWGTCTNVQPHRANTVEVQVVLSERCRRLVLAVQARTSWKQFGWKRAPSPEGAWFSCKKFDLIDWNVLPDGEKHQF